MRFSKIINSFFLITLFLSATVFAESVIIDSYINLKETPKEASFIVSANKNFYVNANINRVKENKNSYLVTAVVEINEKFEKIEAVLFVTTTNNTEYTFRPKTIDRSKDSQYFFNNEHLRSRIITLNQSIKTKDQNNHYLSKKLKNLKSDAQYIGRFKELEAQTQLTNILKEEISLYKDYIAFLNMGFNNNQVEDEEYDNLQITKVNQHLSLLRSSDYQSEALNNTEEKIDNQAIEIKQFSPEQELDFLRVKRKILEQKLYGNR